MKSQKSKMALYGLIFQVIAVSSTIGVLALTILSSITMYFETAPGFYLLIFSLFGTLFYVIPFIVSCVPYIAKGLGREHAIYMLVIGTLCTIIFMVGAIISTVTVMDQCNVGQYNQYTNKTYKSPVLYCNVLRAIAGMAYSSSIGYFVALVIDAYNFRSLQSKPSYSFEMDTLNSDNSPNLRRHVL